MAKKNTDTVPAMLTPGEFVIKKKSAKKIGYGKLNQMNKTGKVNTKKEAKMPQGKGTYGSKVGRPPKKATCYDTGGTVKEEKKKSKLGSKSKAIPWKTPSGFEKAKKTTSKGKKTKGVKGFMQRLIPGGETGYEKKKPKVVKKETKPKVKKNVRLKAKEGTKWSSPQTGRAGKPPKGSQARKDIMQKRKKAQEKASPKKKSIKDFAVGSKERAAEYKRRKWKPDETVTGTHTGAYKKTAPKGKMKSETRAKEYAERGWAGDDTVSQEAIDKYKSKAKKMQYGGKVSGLKGRNVFDGVEFDEDRMHGGKINKKQFGGKVLGMDHDDVEFDEDSLRGGMRNRSRSFQDGGKVTSEGYPVHGGSGNYKVGE